MKLMPTTCHRCVIILTDLNLSGVKGPDVLWLNKKDFAATTTDVLAIIENNNIIYSLALPICHSQF